MSPDPTSPRRHLAAVWFADIVGYSRLAARDEPAALRGVEHLQTLAREAVAESGGRIVKGLGDAVLAEFTSTESAVRAALVLRERYTREASGVTSRRLRIGIHVGDVVGASDGDLYGDGVNVASRLQDACTPGEVLVSEDVWRQLRQRPEYRFTARGERTLMGQDEPTQVFAVDEAIAVGSTAAPSAEPIPAEAESRSRRRLWPIDRIAHPRAALAVGAVLALAVLAAWLGPRFRSSAGGAAELVTLAVLPFDNLSGDDATEAFVLGVHDDVLTNLSAIGTFRVISRSSVMGYRESNKTIPEIGRDLGATVVLEGAIQRSGDRIRINVQLIDAQTDQHLWAHRYNRALTAENVFAIQGEIAERIAVALRTVLSPAARADIARPPTMDMEALDLYYGGIELYRRRGASAATAREAERVLEAALAEDPQFAAAWAALARARAWLVRIGIETDPARAQQALDRARILAPEAHETALAEGDFLYYAQGDFHAAADHFTAALERWPNDSEIHQSLAIVLRRLGRWPEAVANFEEALEQDPRNVSLHQSLGSTYWMLRDYEKANRSFDRILALGPDNQDALIYRFMFLLESKADLAGAKRYLAQNADRFEPGFYATLAANLAYYERDYAGGLADLELAPFDPDFPHFTYFYRAVLSRGAGREAEARAWADSLAAAAEWDLDRARAAARDPFGLEAKSLGWRGVAYAILGRSEEATRDAERAAALLPLSRDAVEGAEVLDFVQMIHALTGNREAAFPAIEAFYLAPAAVRAGSGRLRLEPTYDSLRGDPRFAAVVMKVEGLEQGTVSR
jgi:serine/threonine-protein kinase